MRKLTEIKDAMSIFLPIRRKNFDLKFKKYFDGDEKD